MLNNIKNGPFNPSKSHVVHKITLICAHLRPSFCTYRHVSPNSLKKQRYLHWLLKTPCANEDAFMRCWRRLPKIRLIDLWNASLQRSATTHLCFVPIMITYTLLPKLSLFPIESRMIVILQVALQKSPLLLFNFCWANRQRQNHKFGKYHLQNWKFCLQILFFCKQNRKRNCKQRWI